MDRQERRDLVKTVEAALSAVIALIMESVHQLRLLRLGVGKESDSELVGQTLGNGIRIAERLSEA